MSDIASANPSATKALYGGIGLNWHLNRNVKINLNYENTDFTGGSGNAALATDEQLFLTRAQITF